MSLCRCGGGNGMGFGEHDKGGANERQRDGGKLRVHVRGTATPRHANANGKKRSAQQHAGRVSKQQRAGIIHGG